MYMNQLTVIGFTGQDAEFHFTSNGTPVTTLSVATTESWKNQDGEWQSRTEWAGRIRQSSSEGLPPAHAGRDPIPGV
jgi:single stranded DNA-binding protein